MIQKATIKTLKIAVTGSAGSGKSSVCECLQQKGVKVISSDVLAKEAVAPGSAGLKRIKQYFGAAALNEDGTLNRAYVRRRILAADSDRKKLESFVHPEIIERIQGHIASAEKEKLPAIVVEVPLLFELSLADRFDVILLVAAGRRRQIDRLVKRDRVTKDDAAALLNVQMSDDFKIDKSDYVIYNNSTVEKLQAAAASFYDEVIEKT